MSAVDYARYVYYDFVLSGEFDSAFSDAWISEEASFNIFKWALTESISRYGYHYNNSSDELVSNLIVALIDKNALKVEGDEYTGLFHRLVVAKKDTYIKAFVESDPVALRLAQLGSGAISTALRRVAAELGWLMSPDDDADTPPLGEEHEKAADADWTVPASDRIVTRDDNSGQFDEIEGTLSDIRKALAEDNHVGDVLGDEREIIDQEMEIAQKVVEIGKFRVSSLMGWLLRSLRYISEKFIGTAVSEAAKHLWTLLQALF